MPQLDPRVRTALTLAVLLALIGVGAAWGWSSATKPLPDVGPVSSGPCRSLEVLAGEKVHPEDVVVSVFNGSTRAGLAQRTLALFVDDGFGAGEVNNAPRNSGVTNAEIWAANPEDPAVQLVASRLKDVDIIEGPALGAGVVVLVGDKFPGLATGVPFITATSDVEICAPVPVESALP